LPLLKSPLIRRNWSGSLKIRLARTHLKNEINAHWFSLMPAEGPREEGLIHWQVWKIKLDIVLILTG